MLVRVRKLKEEVETFIEEERHLEPLTNDEWQYIDYLIEILHPFCIFTNTIGRTRNGPTIHDSFPTYNKLFDQMEMQLRKLQSKRKVPWKKQLEKALEAGRRKLISYYELTKTNLGNIYGIATLLAPEYKKSYFDDNNDWIDNDGSDWVCISVITMIMALSDYLQGQIYNSKLHELYVEYQATLEKQGDLPTHTSYRPVSSSRHSSATSTITLPPLRTASSAPASTAESSSSRVIRELPDLKRKAYDYDDVLGKKKRKTYKGNGNDIEEYYANETRM